MFDPYVNIPVIYKHHEQNWRTGIRKKIYKKKKKIKIKKKKKKKKKKYKKIK